MPDIRSVGEQDHTRVVSFLLESAQLYPGIDEWYRRKVLPDLATGKRLELVLETGSSVGGLLIAKRGQRAKICSIRVREDLQEQGWGSELLRRAASDLMRRGAQQVFMTVSEALDRRHTAFFEAAGFTPCARIKDKYVQGVDEFVYSWSEDAIRAFLAAPRPGPTQLHGDGLPARRGALPEMLISLKPQYARLILEGRKSIEFRRRFSQRHIGARVLFYVSSPVSSYEFTATIRDIHLSTPQQLWVAHHGEGGVDDRIFEAYFAGTSLGYAIKLAEVRPLKRGIALAEALGNCPQMRPPQSYRLLNRTRELAALLMAHDSVYEEEVHVRGDSV